MRAVGFMSGMIAGALLASTIVISCGTPNPVPPTPPGPPVVVDRFSDQRFSCYGIELGRRNDAMVAASGCLLMPVPGDCLLGLPYADSEIACATRDVGARANAAVLAGETGGNYKVIADAARTWIRERRLGYK